MAESGWPQSKLVLFRSEIESEERMEKSRAETHRKKSHAETHQMPSTVLQITKGKMLQRYGAHSTRPLHL